MKKLNIILINSRDISKLYGIGSYLINLRNELSLNRDVNVIYVEIEFAESGSVLVKKKNNFTTINITLKQAFHIKHISSTCASLIFHTIILNTNIKDGIFHLNVSDDLELSKIAKNKSFKVIFTQHTSIFNESTKEYYREKIPPLYKIIDGCIFLSEETKKVAHKYLLFPEEKSTVIYNGINLVKTPSSQDIIRKKLGFLNEDFIAIFVGRLDKSKGLTELIIAFKKFCTGSYNKKLIIIGGGDFVTYLNITKDNIANFYFTGFLNKKELFDFYQIADLGILPSHSEQSSLTVVEMIHNDIPLILSDIAGFSIFKDNEVIKTPINISNEGININIDALVKNLETIYNDRSIGDMLIKNTAHYKERLMNIKYSTLKTIEFYKKISFED